ncbi:MAG: hypothetical protein U9N02_02100 [Campylobacterota bacterium]|nr:hypothetical protein [Campylobacterota bacterium]
MRKIYHLDIFFKELSIIEFEHILMSNFSNITKGISYEQTRY